MRQAEKTPAMTVTTATGGRIATATATTASGRATGRESMEATTMTTMTAIVATGTVEG